MNKVPTVLSVVFWSRSFASPINTSFTPASIAANAFNGKELTSVVIPNSISYIGENSFSNNQISKVTMPESVVFIGGNAFLNNRLTELDLPNVIFIEIKAFQIID